MIGQTQDQPPRGIPGAPGHTRVDGPRLLIDSGISFDAQSWNLHRVYAIHDGHRDVRLSLELHHDSSYPRQSHYRISRWDGTQWQLLLRRDPHTDAMTSLASAYLPREIRQQRVQADADRVAADLLADALAVIGDPSPDPPAAEPAPTPTRPCDTRHDGS